jgi:hypothetical protein
MKKTFIILAFIFVLPFILMAQQNSYVSPAGTKFLLYTPPSYATGTQTHPLLISLHGKGEMGDDITKLTSNNPQQQPSRLIYLNRWSKTLPFIVLSPLFTPPPDELTPQWPAAYIDEVVRYVTENYRVDMKRIYVTGLSLGGTGTWTYAAAYPEKVAAIVPISGRSDLTKACALKNIPAWVFHGEGDPTVTLAYSVDMINAINNCKVSALYRRKLTVMETRGHAGWNEIYNGSNGYKIYDWLLKFTKGVTTNTAPYVNAGLDRTIMLRPSSFHLYGDYFDADGSISSVLWKQIAGTPLTLSNTTTGIFKISNLQTGTFEFELSVTDNHGATSTDRVIINIVSSSSTLPAVNNVVLMNGQTNTDIKNLTELMVINKAELGITQINLRAEATANTGSVRFSINTDQHTRTLNSPGPYYLKVQSTSSPEWEIQPGHYVVCATAYANTGASGTPGLTNCFKVKVVDDAVIAGCESAGKIYREIWPGITGTSVSSIPVASRPTARTELSVFESPTDVWDNFGERIFGYLCPPASGNYTFWISSNDHSELWLSTDTNAANKTKIAYVNGTTNVRQYNKYASQQSVPVALQAGTKYYIEALHKEGIESDHLSVGWQLPNGTFERPIPGKRLIPIGTTSIASDLSGDILSAEETGASEGFSLYPNPINRTELMLHLNGLDKLDHDGPLKIVINSIAGETIFEQDANCDSCTQHTIDFGKNLSPGIYVVSVMRGNRRMSKRFVVL